MHDNSDNKGMRTMMWMMTICCALPLILILLFGAGGKAQGVPSWVVLGTIVLMIISHFFMMRRSNRDLGNEHDGHKVVNDTNVRNDNNTTDLHSGHGCCH